jgi:hypothetical protein
MLIQIGPQITREQAERLTAFSREISHLDGPPILKGKEVKQAVKKIIYNGQKCLNFSTFDTLVLDRLYSLR